MKEEKELTEWEILSDYKKQKLESSRKTNREKFDSLITRFNLNIIEEINGIITFTFDDDIYYFGITKGKIRKKGENEWTTRIIGTFNNGLKKRKTKQDDEIAFDFGKYKGVMVKDVDDTNYLIWLLRNYKFYGKRKKIKDRIEKLEWYDEWFKKEHPYYVRQMERGLFK